MNILLRSFITKHGYIPSLYSYNLRKTPVTRIKNVSFASMSSINNINVVKDVILFKYENPKFYKYLNIFAVVNFLLWAVMGKFSVSSMKDVPVPANLPVDAPWWRKVNLGEPKYKHLLSSASYIFGTAVLGCSWIFTLRSVRYLILNKGGQKLSIVTYTPFGENRILTVPLDKVSCSSSRKDVKTMLPLKVKNYRLRYLMDMTGEFRNPQLFDITAGMRRKL